MRVIYGFKEGESHGHFETQKESNHKLCFSFSMWNRGTTTDCSMRRQEAVTDGFLFSKFQRRNELRSELPNQITQELGLLKEINRCQFPEFAFCQTLEEKKRVFHFLKLNLR